jgi:hypothetical protein
VLVWVREPWCSPGGLVKVCYCGVKNCDLCGEACVLVMWAVRLCPPLLWLCYRLIACVDSTEVHTVTELLTCGSLWLSSPLIGCLPSKDQLRLWCYLLNVSTFDLAKWDICIAKPFWLFYLYSFSW